MTKHRVLIAGVLSPVVGFGLLACIGFYAEHINVHVFRFSEAVVWAMLIVPILPALFTIGLAIKDSRRHALPASAGLGLLVSLLSLWAPSRIASPALKLWKESRNLAIRNVPAPRFDTQDLEGKRQRLGDHLGEVVLVNIWATWCGPCRAEMPKLDQLYRKHKRDGLTVFGLSDEDAASQRKCLEQIPVSYPLLTYSGDVPAIYRNIAMYPTIFVIDRQGRIQGGMAGDQPAETLESAVTGLLNASQ